MITVLKLRDCEPYEIDDLFRQIDSSNLESVSVKDIVMFINRNAPTEDELKKELLE